ncbi:MAG: PepSY-like domain-containing protein [Bacteroides sp.]|nr:PepSY-like domain-containing protein [Bacteroides sp.]MCM1095120.1 PepSY-like domain-containing protein [Terasakiella sp.]
MKKLIYLIALLPLLAACSDDGGDYDALPRTISTFVSQYWPDPDVESYTKPRPGVYVVIIKNGPELTFDASYQWTRIDGCGMPLQQTLLYDQLPSPLYRYLEECEYTGQVFLASRTPRRYGLRLLTDSITYDVATATVRELR